MNKVIIVGIDFSNCSINALKHAISIARNAKANILMVWVNHLDYSKEIFSVEPQNVQEEAITRLEELIKEYQYHLNDGVIDYVIKKGKVYKELAKLAAEKEAFMVLVGTHGSSGFEEFWVGSNANRVVASCTRPIITIRGGVDIGKDLKRIIVPIDSTNITRQKLPMVALLAKYFNSEVYIMGILTSSSEEFIQKVKMFVIQAEEYFAEHEIKYQSELFKTDNITKETLKYAKKINANLIAIMTEQETTASNLFYGPYATQMINHSPIPVLSIHASEY